MPTERTTPTERSMTRRRFLRLSRNVLLGIGASLVAETGLAIEVKAQEPVLREIPPTIMFHARENQKRILPDVIEYFQQQGYTFTTYQEWYRALESGEKIDKPVILTFDDITFVETSQNFSFYAEVIDILRDRGVKGVFGVITEPVVVGADGNTVQLTQQNQAYGNGLENGQIWVSLSGQRTPNPIPISIMVTYEFKTLSERLPAQLV